jgi:peptidoglycan/xylan/chitin deacetylase (PgdA/CDA1 family)
MEERIIWPNGARMAFMLSFDVDGESLWYAIDPENARRPKVLSLGTYGPLRGMPRILDLLDELDIKATFFYPGFTAEKYPEGVKEAARRGHEIAFHGYLHENFGELNEKEQREIFTKTMKILEDLTGQKVKGFRTPAGDLTKETLELLEEYDFTYSSSMRGDDRPYRIEIDGRATNLVEMPAHWELDDFFYFGFNFKPPVPAGQCRIFSTEIPFQVFTEEFKGYYKYGLMYVIMFHPQVIGKPGRMLFLKKFLDFVKSYPDVWFAKGADIAGYWSEKHFN